MTVLDPSTTVWIVYALVIALVDYALETTTAASTADESGAVDAHSVPSTAAVPAAWHLVTPFDYIRPHMAAAPHRDFRSDAVEQAQEDSSGANADVAITHRADRLSDPGIISRVDELLELRYRSDDLGDLDDPLDVAVCIVLSVQPRTPVCRTVFEQLAEAFPRGWHDVLHAGHQSLVEILRPAGFQQQAAKLRRFLAAVASDSRAVGEDGSLSLEFLSNLDDGEALKFLESLPGIGPDAALCVMAHSLNREVFACDTPVRRVLGRLGLVDMHPGKSGHRDDERMVPEKIRRRLHVNLVRHGTAVCGSQQPLCEECVLVSFCPVGQKAVVERSTGPVAVELFAGAGGLGEGFRRAGYRLAAAVERDRDPAQTYRLNHPGTPVLEADVSVLDETDLLRLAPGLQDVAVLLAGPPCQGYSAAGRRDPEDPANGLYKEIARFAKLLQPEIVVLENVAGLRRVNGVSFTQRIRRAILNAGYKVGEPAQLKASHFGVSQNRSRLFYLARRSDLGPAPPPPRSTHAAPNEHPNLGSGEAQLTPRLQEVLSGLPDLGPGVDLEYGVYDGRPICNASTMAHSQRVVDKISGIGPGEGPISYRRLDCDIARTLVAGHRALPVHPSQNRTISVREAARIQGFADDYVFAGIRSNQPLQVANAVPPPVAEAIALHLLDYLSEQWGRTRAGRHKQKR